MHKAMLVVMDGLGDRPLRELGGFTPLEAAHTPNLDALGRLTGLMVTPEIINLLGLSKLIGD